MKPANEICLSNGLRVIVAEDHAAPVAAVSFWVRAGACEEPSGHRGIAHFVEHMMFRGSERFAAKEHTDRIQRIGGRCNAYTSLDATVYYQVVPATRVADVFELEADRFQRIRFKPENTDTERKVIVEELQAYENQPVARAFHRLMEFVGGDHPYAVTPLGRRQDLDRIDTEALFAFYQCMYRPFNVFVLACGAVDTAEIESLARAHFGGWADPERPQPAKGRPYRPRLGAETIRLPFQAPLALRAHALKPRNEEDNVAVEMLVSLLAHGHSSPLNERLVIKSRLCVHAGLENFSMRQGGALAMYGAFLPPRGHAGPRRALKEICDELATHGPGEELFSQHLKQFRKSAAYDGYNPERRLVGLGNAEILEHDFRSYERRLDDLASVTPERIRILAQRLFAPANTLELDVIPEDMKWWMWPLGMLMRIWPR